VSVQLAMEEFAADHSADEAGLVFGTSSLLDGRRLVIDKL